MDETKREPLLCPFRKETFLLKSPTTAAPFNKECFLPCLEEKCSAWAGGALRSCMIPNWQQPEV